jgi:protein-tyrosine phosphatase
MVSEKRDTVKILFICTGNIFRSMVAEYALRSRLQGSSGMIVGSAGIVALPQLMHPIICEALTVKGADPSGHVQRKLTRELLEDADVPVAMGLDHQAYIRRHFDRDVVLFNQICYQREEPVLDVHEAIPDWHLDARTLENARAYTLSVVEYIFCAMPAFLDGLIRLQQR